MMRMHHLRARVRLQILDPARANEAQNLFEEILARSNPAGPPLRIMAISPEREQQEQDGSAVSWRLHSQGNHAG
jgi:hypothetical protein